MNKIRIFFLLTTLFVDANISGTRGDSRCSYARYSTFEIFVPWERSSCTILPPKLSFLCSILTFEDLIRQEIFPPRALFFKSEIRYYLIFIYDNAAVRVDLIKPPPILSEYEDVEQKCETRVYTEHKEFVQSESRFRLSQDIIIKCHLAAPSPPFSIPFFWHRI